MEGDKRKLLHELSGDQQGLVTRAQILEAGFSRSAIDRRLRSGELELACPHVCRVRDGREQSESQRLLAACLSLGPEAVASHRSAAWLWGLDGFRHPPQLHEVTTIHGRKVKRQGVKIHQRRDELAEGYTLKAGVPVTVLTRMLLDLARAIPEVTLEIALDSSARGRPELFLELHEFLCTIKSKGRSGINRLRAMLKVRLGGEPTGSAFETELFRVLRRADLPLPILQYPVFKELDRPFVHVDFAWPYKRIALFADGSSYHQARRRARLDATQRLELIKLGWKPVVIIPSMLKDPNWISSFTELFWPGDPFEGLR